MPEIAEALLISLQLERCLKNKEISAINYKEKSASNDEKSEKSIFFPLTVDAIFSKGKQIIFTLHETHSKKKWYIINHLGMTGRWSLQPLGGNPIKQGQLITNQKTFYYTDSRGIGKFELTDNLETIKTLLSSLAPTFDIRGDLISRSDSLLSDVDIIKYEEFKKRITKAKRSGLMLALMDQHKLVSGVGNYVQNEVFYLSKLTHNMKCGELTDNDCRRLYDAIVSVTTCAFEYGGLSVNDYYHLDGSKGKYDPLIYGKETTKDGKRVNCIKGSHGRSLYIIE